MRTRLSSETTAILNTLRDLLLPEERVYLVGGAVRDLLLGRPLHDLDFAMPTDPTPLARRLARKLGVGFYVLDDARQTSRAVYRTTGGQPFPLDFVTFTGGSLIEDLRYRDFTINAMALEVRDLETLIDPLGGEADLAAGVLRLCRPGALLDDPVRVLRAVRLALQFGLAFAPGLADAIQQAAAHLPETSQERQRDEVFRILMGPEPAQGLGQLYDLGVLSCLIPELDPEAAPVESMRFTLSAGDLEGGVLKKVDSLLRAVRVDASPGQPQWLLEALKPLMPFAERLRRYLAQEITPGRQVGALLLLAAMLVDLERERPISQPRGEEGQPRAGDDTGADQARRIAGRLALSNAEGDFLRTLIRHRDRLHGMARDPLPPSRRSIYQFYQDTGRAGVAIVLLSIADAANAYDRMDGSDDWQAYLLVSENLLTAWWDAQEDVVNPPLLLDGNELQRAFDLKPGARIGKLLALLKEAQASGEVENKEQARAFIRKALRR